VVVKKVVFWYNYPRTKEKKSLEKEKLIYNKHENVFDVENSLGKGNA